MTPAAGSDRYDPANFLGWLSVVLAWILVPRKFGKFGKFGKFNPRLGPSQDTTAPDEPVSSD